MPTIAQLLDAARTNNVTKLREIVSSGQDINAFGQLTAADLARVNNDLISLPGLSHLPALHVACLHGKLEAVNACIELNANINIPCLIPAAHCAAVGGNAAILEVLMDHGADMGKSVPYKYNFPSFFGPSHPRSTTTAECGSLSDLIKMIKAGDTSIATFLNYLAEDKEGSCLYFALALGHVKQIQELLAAGASVKPKHYYAAGLSNQHQQDAVAIYNLLPKLPADSQMHKVSELYFAIMNNESCKAIDMLRDGANVKPKHYFAAGYANSKSLYNIVKDSQTQHQPNLESKDPFEVLGVSFYASIQQIKDAYHKLAKLYHTDVTKKIDDVTERNIRIINDAHDKLKDRDSYLAKVGFYSQTSSASFSNSYAPRKPGF